MAIRKIDFELEAKLTGTSGGLFSKPSGKLERKSYRDGGERLKIVLRGLKLADRSEVGLCADGVEFARLTINGGSARYDQEGAEIAAQARLAAGQTIEAIQGGTILLRGELYRD